MPTPNAPPDAPAGVSDGPRADSADRNPFLPDALITALIAVHEQGIENGVRNFGVHRWDDGDDGQVGYYDDNAYAERLLDVIEQTIDACVPRTRQDA